MPDTHSHLTPQQRAWARALGRCVHPAAAPDAPQLDALFSDLSRALQREEESLRYADALGQLRRCAAAVILLAASISLSLWSSDSAEARFAHRSEGPAASAAPAAPAVLTAPASPVAPVALFSAAAPLSADAADDVPAAPAATAPTPITAPAAPSGAAARAKAHSSSEPAAMPASAAATTNASPAVAASAAPADLPPASPAPARRVHLDILPLP